MLRSVLRPAVVRGGRRPLRSGAPCRGVHTSDSGPGGPDDVGGVEPQVSLYARVATAVFIGGASYYVYTEHGPAIARYLPWPVNSSSGGQLAETHAKEGKDVQSRRQRLRDQLAPKSAMSAHEQVNWAWMHPGLYVVGSNAHGLVDPMHPGSGAGLRSAVPGLEGRLLRGAAFAKTHAAAVDCDGNVYQWGAGFAGRSGKPHMAQLTLSDSDIVAVAASRDYAVLLDSRSRIRLLQGDKSRDNAGSRDLEFAPQLGWREHVVAVSAGDDHVAATTSCGHVYTGALGPSGNDRGQLGHSGQRPFELRRIESSGGRFASAVCGGRHTLLLTNDGDVWGCGSNDYGQLATGTYSDSTRTVVGPAPLRTLWDHGIFQPRLARALRIAAGARSSYIQVARGTESLQVLAVGCGIDGQLGCGAFTHAQGNPVRIAALSDITENDPATGQPRPVGLRAIATSGSSDHVVAVCDNHTNVVLDKSAASTSKAPLYGYDVVVWGSNSSGQCIPDRKHRFAMPEHPPPLYTSTQPEQAPARLQAAPRQWVSAASFKNCAGPSKSKKYLVEQEFVTGPDVTAAFLKPV
ncbi:hypothetical protein GGI20_003351 [Coemansia sp. BCRC 34301]|nr:hypothetical protein GGI20_003351 [Coemansia sp. BCRC 34301]